MIERPDIGQPLDRSSASARRRQRAAMRGFLMFDYLERAPEAIGELAGKQLVKIADPAVH